MDMRLGGCNLCSDSLIDCPCIESNPMLDHESPKQTGRTTSLDSKVEDANTMQGQASESTAFRSTPGRSGMMAAMHYEIWKHYQSTS